uniref:SHSP domain-containing protein n=1 Tax=Graphocephala atropunctata TaxID=36148 RepID=A0A1B6KB94_9HEMI
MIRQITKYLTHIFHKSRPSRPRFPTYKQILHGGFGEYNGGSYVLEMETYPFKEEDIQVRVKKDEILIEGKMEERLGDDFMMYVFTKKCRPPHEVDITSIEYKFEGDRLFLTARTNK